MAVDLKGRGLEVLCDRHVIPMLMFLRENGPSTKTQIYSAIGRSSNMPANIDRLREAGLVTVEVVGISKIVGLTDIGGRIAGILTDVDALITSQ